MTISENEILRYRRQYVIAPEQINCPFINQETSLNNNYTLYTHPDLLVTEFIKAEIKLILLGDMFDYIHPGSNNLDILKNIIDKDLNQFLERTSRYTGRFVLIYQNIDQIYLVTDATATKKVYFSNRDIKLWVASQSHLLGKLLGLSKTSNKSKLEYYDSRDFIRQDYANIGNTTYYDEIVQLLPNHYLNVFGDSVSRFWPNKRIDSRPLDEVAEECAKMVKGYMEAIAARYNPMLPVTAGKDSRLLLAGTRNIKEKFYYYINREVYLTENSADINIPQRLFKKLDLPFHPLELPTKIDDDFRRIYLDNNPLADEKFLPHIFNYYLHYQSKVNLPGNFAAAPWQLFILKKKSITAHALAKLHGLSDYKYAVSYYNDWLQACKQLCSECNIRPINLFYWEERLANWGTQTQMDKDIAQDDINPLNSRMLAVNFLSVKAKYNNSPDYQLHRKIIKILWPELLSVPINPSRNNRILKGLNFFGLMNLFRRVIYRLRNFG